MSELVVNLYSFGYQFSGIPEDLSDNNGGFVFDCRFLPNPGREPAFYALTGRDREVIDYLEPFPQVQQFLKNIFSIIDMVISNYKQREFTNLMISFGCTGGQHRSVYCAEQLKKHIHTQGVTVNLHHIEQDF
jgi:RNase adaptor protein for sRNA GlmZ degradation